MDIGGMVGYGAVREAKVKHREYSVLKEFADAFDFPRSLFEKMGPHPRFLDKRRNKC